MKTVCQLFITFFILIFTAGGGLAFGGGNMEAMSQPSAPALPQDQVFPMQVPVFSSLFAGTPVAMVDDQPILLSEVTPELQEVREETPMGVGGAALTKRFNQVLGRMVEERSQGKDEPNVQVFAEGAISDDRILTLQVPIFSPHFLFTPVAAVDEEPIPMGEFTRELGAMHSEMGQEGAEVSHTHEQEHENQLSAADLLDRLLTVRLVAREARNIGLDETQSLQQQVGAFAEKTLLYELLGRQVENMSLDEAEVDRIYHEISLAAKLRSYRFQKKEHAVAFMKQLDEGAEFDELIQKYVEEGKATGGEEEEYVPFKELRDQVASAANKMEVGEVSKIYPVADGFVVFKLEDKKFIEDPAALQMAQKIVWDQQVAKKGQEYIAEVIEQYTTYNEEAREDFNFSKIKEENPDIQLADALLKFFDDQRVLATVEAAGKTYTMTVKELAERLKETYFHGTEIDLNAAEADKRAQQILNDWIFRIAGKVEAQKIGLDESLSYKIKVEEFERRTLFDNFMQKAIVSDIKLTEKELQSYYDEHLEEYSTPKMFKLKSLVFYEKDDAFDALDKLRKGSDFKWVSANSEGLAPVEDKDLLDFSAGILSYSSLPDSLQEEADGAKRGDAVLFSDSEKFHYVIYFDNIYPSEPKPYEQVRSQILEKVFQKHVTEALNAYVKKLKEHYPTAVYLTVKDN